MYPTAGKAATGKLYLDDGRSFDYLTTPDKYSAMVTYDYNINNLASSLTWGTSYTDIPLVSSVNLHGITQSPLYVTDKSGAALTMVYES